VNTNAQLAGSAGHVGSVELRRSPRYPILQRCLVFPSGAPTAQAWKCIAYNISLEGIALTLPLPLQKGTLLRIAAWDLPHARPLQARVVHARVVEFCWFAGCELLEPLSPPELSCWRSGSAIPSEFCHAEATIPAPANSDILK
jgi:PilZ domain